MQPFLIPAMGAVTLIAITSFGLMRKGSSTHLRQCLFSFCMMSLTQGAIIACSTLGASAVVTSFLQLLLAGFSLQGMYLLSAEMVTRSRAERKPSFAVVQAESPIRFPPPVIETAAWKESRTEIVKGSQPIENSALVTTPVCVEDLERSTLRATADLLLLLGALTASSEQPSPNVTVKKYLAASRPKTSNQPKTAIAS